MPFSVTCVLFDQGRSGSGHHRASSMPRRESFALHRPVAVSFALVVEHSVRCFFVYLPRSALKNSPRHKLHAVLNAGGLVAINAVVGGSLREACSARLNIVGALRRK